MPTYQYVCKACGHEFEESQPISSDPLIRCPSCNQDTLTRMIGGGAGLIFKGSGFYLTDYKKKDSKGKDSEKPPPAEKKTEAPATEKKPAEESSTPQKSKPDSEKKK